MFTIWIDSISYLYNTNYYHSDAEAYFSEFIYTESTESFILIYVVFFYIFIESIKIISLRLKHKIC